MNIKLPLYFYLYIILTFLLNLFIHLFIFISVIREVNGLIIENIFLLIIFKIVILILSLAQDPPDILLYRRVNTV